MDAPMFHKGTDVSRLVPELVSEVIPWSIGKKYRLQQVSNAITEPPELIDKPHVFLKGCFQLPECIGKLSFDIEEENCVGIHIRRGDYLRYGFTDLASTDYYTLAKDWIDTNAKDLPIKLFIENTEDIPQEIYDLFPNAEIISGDPYDDFFALASCKYKVLANSTFSLSAAYALPTSICCYPKNCNNKKSNFGQRYQQLCLSDWEGLENTCQKF